MIQNSETLKRTALTPLHEQLGARLVPFAGYEMPVQFEGILAEHLHTRAAAGLFDVSHMGQAFVRGPSDEAIARALEAMMPSDLLGLEPGQMRYCLLLTPDGGIADDLMATRLDPAAGKGAGFYLVVNAATKDQDFDTLAAGLPAGLTLERLEDAALIALQGPKAVDALSALVPDVRGLTFMQSGCFSWQGAALIVSRSGYTGEDGFEISVPSSRAEDLARALLAHDAVRPIGLGARDSLRLEAGLCLSGHDIGPDVTPVEASLTWAIAKRRRAEGGFPGAERILQQIKDGAARRRVGLKILGRQPAREGAEICSGGAPVGALTSGGFGPTVGGPIAMGYVPAALAKPGTGLGVLVRGKELPAETVSLPFVSHTYVR